MNTIEALSEHKHLKARQRTLENSLIQHMNKTCNKLKYTSGLVRGNNCIGETNYHRLYELKKPFKIRLLPDWEHSEQDLITHIGSKFFMCEDGGLGSECYRQSITTETLIKLVEHIEKDVLIK